MSVINKLGYLTVNRRTGIMIDLAGSRCSSRPCSSVALLWLRVAHLNDFIRCFCLFWHIFSNLSWLSCCCLIPIVQTINDATRIFIFIQCHDIILNSNILSFTHYATDFNLALELSINKIEGEKFSDLERRWRLSVSSQMLLRCSYICPKRRVLLVVEMVGILVWLLTTLKSAKSCRTYQSAHVFPGVEVWQLRIDPDVNCKYPSLRKLM